ncbi:MAG: universal stress protein, partial [Hafnia sp.]
MILNASQSLRGIFYGRKGDVWSHKSALNKYHPELSKAILYISFLHGEVIHMYKSILVPVDIEEDILT